MLPLNEAAVPFHPSSFPLWLAKEAPHVAKPFLWLWGRYYGLSGKPPHWVFTEMGNAMNYRVPFCVKLLGNLKLKIAVNDYEGQAILRQGCTEAESISLVSGLVTPGSIFFDLGAHVGQYTLIASNLVGRNGAVHSFEPDPETFAWLCDNVRRNKLSNVVANRMAVCDRVGYQDFNVAMVSASAASSLANPKEHSGRVMRVATTSVDSYCHERGIGRIDFMKVDVEGAEIDVLRGATSFLSREEKPAIHVEFHPYTQRAAGRSLRELADVLMEYGYTLFRLTDQGPRKFWLNADEPSVFNVLALSGHDVKKLLGQ